MKLIFVYGYLGSGKTTFIKNLLTTEMQNKKIALVVNDFGTEDVDGKLLKKYNAVVNTVSGGSIFCVCKTDKFVETIINISKTDFDYCLVETSGLANPFSLSDLMGVIQKNAQNKMELSACFCLVDAFSVEKLIASISMISMQIAAADVILLNKTDLVNAVDVLRVKKLVSSINKNAKILDSKFGKAENFGELSLLSCPKTEKILPKYVTDILTQKIIITIKDGTELAEVTKFCKELSEFCHRIKGVIKVDGRNMIFQYMYSFVSLETAEVAQGEKTNFLIALSCGKEPLKKMAKDIIEKYDFIDCIN